MAANHSGEEMVLKLREYRNQGSVTCRRMCDGFALVDRLDTLPVIRIGTEKQYLLGQRVQVNLYLNSDGCIASFEGGLFSVVFDDGSKANSVVPCDITELTKEDNEHLDYVSRIVWANSLTENRLPLSSEQIRGDRCAWGLCDSIFQLTDPWSERLWTSPPQLIIDSFADWLYLFAESIRMKITGGLLYALRVIEECTKHLLLFEMEYTDDNDHLITTGVAEMIKYCPQAVAALGNMSVDDKIVNGGFSLLRFMVSTQAIKTLKAVYRNPVQKDQGVEGPGEVDKELLKTRFLFYCSMQRTAENELRRANCAAVFGDGQSDCNAAWLASLQSDAFSVCCCARRAMQLADEGSNNDFVSAKARLDLAGYLTLGGESPTYDLRVIQNLAREADTYTAAVAPLGMDYFINGEAICAAMVRGILQSYTGAPPHVVQASILNRKPVDVAPKRCCSSCSKATGDLKLCSGCQGAYYCSRDCQAKDFKVHKKACKAAAALRILLNLP